MVDSFCSLRERSFVPTYSIAQPGEGVKKLVPLPSPLPRAQRWSRAFWFRFRMPKGGSNMLPQGFRYFFPKGGCSAAVPLPRTARRSRSLWFHFHMPKGGLIFWLPLGVAAQRRRYRMPKGGVCMPPPGFRCRLPKGGSRMPPSGSASACRKVECAQRFRYRVPKGGTSRLSTSPGNRAGQPPPG